MNSTPNVPFKPTNPPTSITNPILNTSSNPLLYHQPHPKILPPLTLTVSPLLPPPCKLHNYNMKC